MAQNIYATRNSYTHNVSQQYKENSSPNEMDDSLVAFSEPIMSNNTNRYSKKPLQPIKNSMIMNDSTKPSKSNKNDHSHQRLSKYHYHMKLDKIYGDKKLKLCGQCITPANLSNDLKQLRRFVPLRSASMEQFDMKNQNQNKNKKESQKEKDRELKNSYVSAFNINLDESDTVIDFRALDLTTERQSGLNLPIMFLPEELFRFKQLRRLHLDCNHIRNIPDVLGQSLLNLETLTVSNNLLQDLPESISNLKKLESLHLSNNKFEYFPDVVCHIKSLRFLDLSSNELIDISPQINNLKNLESLLLYQNYLKQLPDSICKLNKLRTLWLGNNRLAKLPRKISDLTNLDWTDESFYLSSNLEGNPLVEPPYEVCARGLKAIQEYFQLNKPKKNN